MTVLIHLRLRVQPLLLAGRPALKGRPPPCGTAASSQFVTPSACSTRWRLGGDADGGSTVDGVCAVSPSSCV